LLAKVLNRNQLKDLGAIQNGSSRNENFATVRPAFGRSLSRGIIMFGFQGGESAVAGRAAFVLTSISG
jgi:hypothetical protein